MPDYSTQRCLTLATWALLACALGANVAIAAESEGEQALKDRSIGYVVTDQNWAVYQTADAKAECPQGLNLWGPREQFKELFPDDGTKRTLKETQLLREAQIWHPTKGKDPFPFMEAGGSISFGVDLDGNTGSEDFTSPDGRKGIDNQLYRAIGCNDNFRAPTGIIYLFANQRVRLHTYGRVLIELTEVDDLTNDPDVKVTIMRGRDRLLTDATGERIIPGGTQRVDGRWAKRYVQHLRGKIVDGVLTTEPTDIRMPFTYTSSPSEARFLAGRFRLNLTSERAEGVLAGYSDIEHWYVHLNTNWGTVFQGYGELSSQSFYKRLYDLADGYPDATGANTAVSSAMVMKFTQVFIEHPQKQVASQDNASPSPSALASSRTGAR